jgi:hypothetical protein
MMKSLQVWRMPWSALVGVLIGVFAAPVVTSGALGLTSLYDKAWPVLKMHGELVSASRDEVVIKIRGVKHRSCQYIRLQAMVMLPSGEMTDANIQRISMPENGDTKDPGVYYLGEWRIWPRQGATAVVVNANHLCGDRLIVTRIAEVNVP